jgi:hypothetical protein
MPELIVPVIDLGPRVVLLGARDGGKRVLLELLRWQHGDALQIFDNPDVDLEATEAWCDAFIALPRAVLLTNNPIIFNYFGDGSAKELFWWVFRHDGVIHYFRFFDNPVELAKLEVMGPGEVWGDGSAKHIEAEYIKRITKEGLE